MADGGRAPGAGGAASLQRNRLHAERQKDPLAFLKRQAEEERARLVLPNGEPAFMEDGSVNPKCSLAAPEKTHVREVISKFGGVIKAGSAVSIPPQTWNGSKAAKTMYAQDANFLALHPDSYRSRYQPSHVVASAGISGYTGHKPQNPSWSIPHRRPDLRAKHISPHLEDPHAAEWENYPPQQSHAPDHVALDRNALPAKMRTNVPIPPGYTGHMSKVKTGAQFGTSRWRKDMPTTRADSQKASFASGKKRAEPSKSPPKSPPSQLPFTKHTQSPPPTGWSKVMAKPTSPPAYSPPPRMPAPSGPTGGGFYEGFDALVA